MTEEIFRLEVCNIAFALSKSDQVQGVLFVEHYLSCQNQLIRLKNQLDGLIQNTIQYQGMGNHFSDSIFVSYFSYSILV